jgi:hypothetical protein
MPSSIRPVVPGSTNVSTGRPVAWAGSP